MFWRPGGDDKYENIEQRGEVGAQPIQSETSRLGGGWSEVGQGDSDDGSGDDEEADLAVVWVGEVEGTGKVVRPDIYCPIAGM